MKTIVFIVIASLITLNGCMMMGMGGMTHDSHSDHGTQQSRSVEAQNNNLKAVLTVSNLTMGMESEIFVKVNDRNGVPMSGVKVTMQFDTDSGMKDHQTDGEGLVASETLKKGVYSLKRRFDDHGGIRIAAQVSVPDNSESLVLAMTSEVTHMRESHGGPSMPMIIMGAAMMAVMMVFMISRN